MTEVTIRTDDEEIKQKFIAFALTLELEVKKNGIPNEVKLVSPKRKTKTKKQVEKIPPIDWGSDPESLAELRGIWKDEPRTLEEIRQLAWGDRL